MTWLQRYRLRSFVRDSVWLPPLLGLLAALVANRLMVSVDRVLVWPSRFGVEGSRILLTALASSLLTFIVFVFSILLLAVQLASAQLTPRVIAHFYRNRVLRLSLSIFVFVFTFDLAVVFRIDASMPRPSVSLAVYSSVASIGIFLYMIDRVGKSLRPVAILTGIGKVGQDVIEHVYPRRLDATENAPGLRAAVQPIGDPRRTVENFRPGVVLAFDPAGLAALARKADCVIEVVPQVGDFVARGDPLFRLYGGRDVGDQDLQQSIAIGPERTMEQDPAFAFRIIVDVAAKALSPAINDPTTAVLAIDQLHHLLRSIALRDLDTGRIRDENGRVWLAFRTPDWEDLVGLAVTEVRHYGKDSIQIARRMRAMLEGLIRIVSQERAVRLREELDLLHRTFDRAFLDVEDRSRAGRADSLGMGGAP
jgi:uncharacterized membrane protein